MTARFGLELTTSRCALVTVQPGREGVRVLAFDNVAAGSADGAELKSALRSRLSAKPYPDAVRAVIWGARSLCLTLPIDDVGGVDVQGRVFEAAADAAPEFRSWSSDAWIHLSLTPSGEDGRRLACFVAASGRDLRRLLRPLERAGLQVGQVYIPAMALAMLAQLRRGDAPGTVTAYLALNNDGGCVAIERGGRLLYATDLSWTAPRRTGQVSNPLLERYAFVASFIPDLRHAFDVVRRTHGCAVGQVITCGDLPELRSFTMLLIEELDIEVETLDSLAGIDVRHLPEPPDAFRDQVASLRLAWIAAAAESTIELAPVARHVSRVPAGIAWGLGGLGVAAAILAGVALWPSPPAAPAVRDLTARMVPPRAESAAQVSDSAASDAPAVRSPSPSDGTSRDKPVRTSDEAAARESPISSVGRMPGPTSASTSLRQPGSPGKADSEATAETKAEPPPDRVAETPQRPVREQQTTTAVAPRRRDAAPAAPAMSPSTRSSEPVGRRAALTSRPATREPVVASILYSADSRLAVVDGRVVGIGDAVGDAAIVDITRDEVVVRLVSGATRRWPMRSVVPQGGLR